MATTNVNVRVDSELKKKAEQLYSELGLNMSTAMNIFLKQSVRYGGIPFELRINKPNAETISAIDDANNGRNLSKSFDTVDELFEDLNA
jgi:DNA-damage-inducible protein J